MTSVELAPDGATKILVVVEFLLCFGIGFQNVARSFNVDLAFLLELGEINDLSQ